MDTVFEALLFLAIGLIAVTVTVFVLAVSLLGRAIKISIQEQRDAEEKGKKETEVEIKKIQDKLEESRKEGGVDVEKLRDDLKELEKRQQKYNQRLNWVKTKPSLLRVDGGVLVPGVFFILAIVFIILARFKLTQNPDASVFGFSVGAIVCILLGIYIIYLILKVIESVAITSEETSFIRDKEAFRAAFIEIEKEKQPELKLKFINITPPFHMKANSENSILCDVSIAKGDIARNTRICFWIPQGFTFIDCEEGPLSEEYDKHVSTEFIIGDIIKPRGSRQGIKIKAPVTKGNYTGAYVVHCEGFYSEYQEFNIIVE